MVDNVEHSEAATIVVIISTFTYPETAANVWYQHVPSRSGRAGKTGRSVTSPVAWSYTSGWTSIISSTTLRLMCVRSRRRGLCGVGPCAKPAAIPQTPPPGPS